MNIAKSFKSIALSAVCIAAVVGCEQRPANEADNQQPMDTAVVTTPAPIANDTTQAVAPMAQPDAQMKEVLDKLASLGGKPIETLTPAEARKQPSPADAVKALLKEKGLSTAPEPVGKVVNRTIPGAGGSIPVRIYTPKGTGPFPVIVYYHGGGWVIADLDTYDSSPRALCNAANAIVISSHYRQGPEHKFPAAHQDAFVAYQWAVANAKSLGGDTAKIAVAGESAGGNMAASVAIMARDKKIKIPVHQLLVYPVTQVGMETPSYKENMNAKPLNVPMMKWFGDNYLNTPADADNPVINLLKVADLSGLPPATIILAQIDPLRSDGMMYADKLRAAGVSVNVVNYEGVAHEFFGMGAVVDKAKQAVQQAAAGLKKGFGM